MCLFCIINYSFTTIFTFIINAAAATAVANVIYSLRIFRFDYKGRGSYIISIHNLYY